MKILVYADNTTLDIDAARYIGRIAQESIAAHDRFTIALSGGSSARVYALLSQEPYRNQIDWTRVEIFWGDERCVPPESAVSNYRLAQHLFLSQIPIPSHQIHRMPADQPDRDAASAAYVTEIQAACNHDLNGIPSFDLIHLGIGPEGHTASLFPYQSSLHEQRLIVPVSVPKPPPDRLTFTPILLNAAQHILFTVTGQEKAEAMHAILEGAHNPDEYPAQMIRPPQGEVTYMLDHEAATKLHNQDSQ